MAFSQRLVCSLEFGFIEGSFGPGLTDNQCPAAATGF
jgi:hypothetical protein